MANPLRARDGGSPPCHGRFWGVDVTRNPLHCRCLRRSPVATVTNETKETNVITSSTPFQFQPLLHDRTDAEQEVEQEVTPDRRIHRPQELEKARAGPAAGRGYQYRERTGTRSRPSVCLGSPKRA